MQSQVRVLCLNDNDHREATLYRLQNGVTLRFTLAAPLAAHNVRLMTNHPPDQTQFDRGVFYELEWNSTGASRHDNFDRFAEIQCFRPGSFRYCYYVVDGKRDISDPTGSGYFIVDPELRVGVDDGQLLPLDCIQCQTVLSKCLGPFREWRQRLQVACECGYNMIHFTPIQQLSGESDSSYSIRNHQVVNPLFAVAASAGSSASAEWCRVKEFVAEMKRDWNVMSITDLVLNHIANDSPFFEKCPQAGYNLVNSPHLKPAFILDRVLWYFTLQVAGGNYMARGIPPSITDECHLSDARHNLLYNLLPQHKIEEFYQINVDATLGEFAKRASASAASDEDSGSQHVQLGIVQDPQYRRLQCSVDMELVFDP